VASPRTSRATTAAFVLNWAAQIVHREQQRQMWRWYAISKAHTIYLTDFDGQKYEGIISSLTMARKGKLQSVGRDPSMLYHTVGYVRVHRGQLLDR
jgi:hypothetical protein